MKKTLVLVSMLFVFGFAVATWTPLTDSFETGDYAVPGLWNTETGIGCSAQNAVAKSGNYSLRCAAVMADPENPYNQSQSISRIDFETSASNMDYTFWIRADANSDAYFALSVEDTTQQMVVGVNHSYDYGQGSGYVMVGGSEFYPNMQLSPAVEFVPGKWYYVTIHADGSNGFEVDVYDSDGTTLLGSATGVGDATYPTDKVYFSTNFGNGYFDDVPYGFVEE